MVSEVNGERCPKSRGQQANIVFATQTGYALLQRLAHLIGPGQRRTVVVTKHLQSGVGCSKRHWVAIEGSSKSYSAAKHQFHHLLASSHHAQGESSSDCLSKGGQVRCDTKMLLSS